MRYMRVLLALFVSANLLFAGCHGSRQSAAPVAEEYDRPGLKGVDPAVGQKIVKEARKWLGTKYVYGGKTRKGTDCSGMVMVVYEQVTGIKLPRDSHSQQAFTEHIKPRPHAGRPRVFRLQGRWLTHRARGHLYRARAIYPCLQQPGRDYQQARRELLCPAFSLSRTCAGREERQSQRGED